MVRGIIFVSEDTDNDGVPDATDLDDDNDGILDTDECAIGSLEDGSFEAVSPTTAGQGGLLPNWFKWNSATPDLNEQGGYEQHQYTYQSPVQGSNYVGLVSTK